MINLTCRLRSTSCFDFSLNIFAEKYIIISKSFIKYKKQVKIENHLQRFCKKCISFTVISFNVNKRYIVLKKVGEVKDDLQSTFFSVLTFYTSNNMVVLYRRHFTLLNSVLHIINTNLQNLTENYHNETTKQIIMMRTLIIITIIHTFQETNIIYKTQFRGDCL